MCELRRALPTLTRRRYKESVPMSTSSSENGVRPVFAARSNRALACLVDGRAEAEGVQRLAILSHFNVAGMRVESRAFIVNERLAYGASAVSLCWAMAFH